VRATSTTAVASAERRTATDDPPRQPARRALSLLTSTATAYAECAWVLWWAKDTGDPGSNHAWQPQSAYSDAET